MDYIISFINKYPYLLVIMFFVFLFSVIQLNYGWKAYHYKTIYS